MRNYFKYAEIRNPLWPGHANLQTALEKHLL